MGLGLVVGFLFGGTTTIIDGKEASIIATIRPIGQLYTRLIQMIVVPLVLTAVIKSFTSLETTDKLKTIGLKTLFWLLATTTVAAAIGFFYASITGLGNAFEPIGEYTKTITPIEKVILDFFPTNVVSAIGIAGVLGIATIAAAVVLSSLGLPIEGIALIIAVDPLVDMGRTLINVIGGGVAATFVAKREKKLDYEMLNSQDAQALNE